MALETTAWDVADHLKSPEDERLYLEAAFEDGDPALVAAALGDIARARGMSAVARDAGISREGLYKALSENGNPSFATISKVSRALGFQFKLVAA